MSNKSSTFRTTTTTRLSSTTTRRTTTTLRSTTTTKRSTTTTKTTTRPTTTTKRTTTRPTTTTTKTTSRTTTTRTTTTSKSSTTSSRVSTRTSTPTTGTTTSTTSSWTDTWTTTPTTTITPTSTSTTTTTSTSPAVASSNKDGNTGDNKSDATLIIAVTAGVVAVVGILAVTLIVLRRRANRNTSKFRYPDLYSSPMAALPYTSAVAYRAQQSSPTGMAVTAGRPAYAMSVPAYAVSLQDLSMPGMQGMPPMSGMSPLPPIPPNFGEQPRLYTQAGFDADPMGAQGATYSVPPNPPELGPFGAGNPNYGQPQNVVVMPFGPNAGAPGLQPAPRGVYAASPALRYGIPEDQFI